MFNVFKFSILLTVLMLFSACSLSDFQKSKKEVIQLNNTLDNNIVDLSPYSAEFINQISNIRAKGLDCAPPADALEPNLKLEEAAKAHAKDMAINHMVEHDGSGTVTDPARKSEGIGSTFIDRIIFFGYPVRVHSLVGETLAHTKDVYVQSSDIKEHFKKALDTIIKDEKQCAILMNNRFKNIGIGAYKSKDGYYWAFDYAEAKE